MAIRFIFALMLVCQSSLAFRETPPTGMHIYHAIKEGHDLVLSCPLKWDFGGMEVAEGRNERDGEKTNGTVEKNHDNKVKKAAVYWTRNVRELLSIDGDSFVKYSNYAILRGLQETRVMADVCNLSLTSIHVLIVNNRLVNGIMLTFLF